MTSTYLELDSNPSDFCGELGFDLLTELFSLRKLVLVRLCRRCGLSLRLLVGRNSLRKLSLQSRKLGLELGILRRRLLELLLVSLRGFLRLQSVLGLLSLSILEGLLNGSGRLSELRLKRLQARKRLRVLVAGGLLLVLELQDLDLEFRNLVGLIFILALELIELRYKCVNAGALLLEFLDLRLSCSEGLVLLGLEGVTLCLDGFEVSLRLEESSVLSLGGGSGRSSSVTRAPQGFEVLLGSSDFSLEDLELRLEGSDQLCLSGIGSPRSLELS